MLYLHCLNNGIYLHSIIEDDNDDVVYINMLDITLLPLALISYVRYALLLYIYTFT